MVEGEARIVEVCLEMIRLRKGALFHVAISFRLLLLGTDETPGG